ncbi:MAG: replication initiation negative regulator SeqA [Plesiomonas sp.]|uniref:replication initiation negative regulator SeqA n=1 Tax=Plesiomonas sp. TaxID=2486279 RepID=UPI003F366CCF
MKIIEVDEELYRYIASHTQHIGESASEILRRMLSLSPNTEPRSPGIVVSRDAGKENTVDRVRAIRELLLSDEYAVQTKAIGRFMLILSFLYSLDVLGFTAATEELRGRTRVYFAEDEATLLQHGTHTKPKVIPNTPYWVITNTNSGRKRAMIEQIMSGMQFPSELTEKVCSTI